MFILYLDNFSEERRLGGGVRGHVGAQFFLTKSRIPRGGDGPPNFYSVLRQFFRGASTGGEGSRGGPIFLDLK